jgi:hypothetical protein
MSAAPKPLELSDGLRGTHCVQRLVRCPHVERKERVITTPNGSPMAVMECAECGDQQAGAHHYACERYQAPNEKVSDGCPATTHDDTKNL